MSTGESNQKLKSLMELENWLNSPWSVNCQDACAEEVTANPNGDSKPILEPVVNASTNIGGGSSNVSQSQVPQQMMSSSSVTPAYSNANIRSRSGQIISSAIQSVSNNNTVQQPQSHYITTQSNITAGDQMNLLHYQPPSNVLNPYIEPIANTQTMNLHNNQTPRVPQLQQVPATAGGLMSVGGPQQEVIAAPNLLAPVGFATPSDFSSSAAFREYAFKQIQMLKQRYYNTLSTMRRNVIYLHTTATTREDSEKYESIRIVLGKMMRFLNTPNVDSMPVDDEGVYRYLNLIINYVNYHTKGQPVRLICPPQRVTNLQANAVNSNQNHSSRRPQAQETRMPSTNQRSENPLRIGSSRAQQPTVVTAIQQPTVVTNIQQVNSGPRTSNVIASGSSSSLSPNTTAINIPVVNQQSGSEKMKQPMHNMREFTTPKTPRVGMSPLGSSSMNPTTQQTPVPPSKFNVNKVLQADSIAMSPFLLSHSSSTPSRGSLSTMVGSQKHATPPTPMGPPCQEPQKSKDAVHHLTQVVKSISPNALSSSLTEIGSMEKKINVIPKFTPANGVGKVMLDCFKEPHPKMKRVFIVTSTRHDHFDCQEWDMYPSETSFNKKQKTEDKWVLMEEIKEINAKLLETTIHVVLNPSEDNINVLLGGQQGTIIKCMFRNVCFPDLLGPEGGIFSQKVPEFGILLLVPYNYPASSTKIYRWDQNMSNEPWAKLYEDMLTRFNLLTNGGRGMLFLGDLARNWDASARAVMTEFMQKLGAKSFSSISGSWECCVNSSSSSN